MDAITNFTFQYVSINTSLERAHSRSGTALHSNMFLLILDPKQITVISYNFTFQYVSINTHFSLTEKDQLNLFFTFQYVSINTKIIDAGHKVILPLHSNMFLLIQLRP